MSRLLARLTTVVAVIVGCLAPAAPALAAPELQAHLVGMPVSLGPQDALHIALEVTNKGDAPATDLQVTVIIFEGVRNRTHLHRTFQGRPGTQLGSDTFPIDGTIGPGTTRSIEVAKLLSELVAFREAPSDRAYPVRIIVRAGNVESRPVDTYMVHFSDPQLTPMGISLVIPIHFPSIYTNGNRPNVVTSDSLLSSATSGRLSKLLAVLEEFPDLPVTLAPSGLTLSMLRDLSDGYLWERGTEIVRVPAEDARAAAAARALDRLRALAQRPITRLLTTDYSGTSLPALVKFELEERVQAQLLQSRNLLGAGPAGVLGGQPLRRWAMPSGGTLDEKTLQEVQRSGFDRLILDPTSLSTFPGPLTRAAPVEIETTRSPAGTPSGDPTVALISDPDLNKILVDSERRGAIEARQRFLAETATIMLERPSHYRAVVAVAPAEWNVPIAVGEALLSGLRQAPWIRPTAPDEIVDAVEPQSEPVRLVSEDVVLEKGPALPSQDYFPAIQQALRSLERYAALAPPSSRLAEFSRRLLIAESTSWWRTNSSLRLGRQFARAVPPAVTREIGRIRAPAAQTITLTSRAGVIPLSVGSALS
ncbi:MAG: DUF6049 family protein, partial [Actinomycetota bacterium]|nr:DUF6049 family protein [Actinomycetota bacterium]